jgi:glutathione S-transferase
MASKVATLRPPPDWPKIVTLPASPPNSAMFVPGAPEAGRRVFRGLAERYAYSPEAAAASKRRTLEIVELLAAQLRAQRAAGRRYLVGGELSALDVYWATFAVLLDPLSEEHCRMDPGLRASYTARDPRLRAAAADLLAHRDFVYREHLGLPLDF